MTEYFKAMWQNFKDVFGGHDLKMIFTTPGRLRNLIWRIFESLVGLVVFSITLIYSEQIILSVVLAIFAEFVAFEFFGEPLGLTGNYFERGPRGWEGEGVASPDAREWPE